MAVDSQMQAHKATAASKAAEQALRRWMAPHASALWGCIAAALRAIGLGNVRSLHPEPVAPHAAPPHRLRQRARGLDLAPPG